MMILILRILITLATIICWTLVFYGYHKSVDFYDAITICFLLIPTFVISILCMFLWGCDM